MLRNLLLITVLFLVTAAFDCGGGGKIKPETTIPPTGTVSATQRAVGLRERTNAGLTLVSKNGTTQEVKDIIDSSVLNTIEDAKALGYGVNLDPSFYTIEVKQDCTLSPGGNLSFKVRADNYDGDPDFDLDPRPGFGEVYAPELVKQDGKGNLIPEYVICQGDLELIKEIARYGLEHLLHYYNDKQKYKDTETHQSGTGHPILEKRSASL